MRNLFITTLFILSRMICGSEIYSQNEEDQFVMKEINVKYLTPESTVPEFEEIKTLFNENLVEFQKIDQVNWDNYPYKPDVKFRIAYSDTEIFLQYNVKESAIKAIYGEDKASLPYKDSCVEFFMAFEEDSLYYYNLEMNCIGFGTLGKGAGRGKRTNLGIEDMATIRRESSLGNTPFGTIEKETEWTLTLAIPIKLFDIEEISQIKGRVVRANFYKCGDDMPLPHYLSWNPIDNPRPNFHLPKYFGKLLFE